MIQGQQVHKQIPKRIGRDVFSNISNPVLVAAKGLRKEGTASSGRGSSALSMQHLLLPLWVTVHGVRQITV